MNSGGRWASLIFRIGYGLFFFVVGLYGSYYLLSEGGSWFTVEPGPGADFQAALLETGFIAPAMYACYIVGGAALFFNRTSPLGIVVLAPFIVVIFFYNVLLGGSVAWAVFWAGGLVFLAYLYRSRLGVLVGSLPANDRSGRSGHGHGHGHGHGEF